MGVIEEMPSLDEIRLFMAREGWVRGPDGPIGSLWSRGDVKIGVPESGSDRSLIQGLVERLAQASERDPGTIAHRIHYYGVDVTDFRASMHDSEDTIPLGVAEIMTRNARILIQSAATTAGGVRGDLRGNYSKFSGELVSKARMGHTKRGSFIIPVLVPLSRPGDEESKVDESRGGLLDGTSRVATPEPYERRAVRTLAQSLRAVQDVIIDPGVVPTMHSLHDAVELGVSRELCQAVGQILEHPGIAEFDATFYWAELIKPPGKIPVNIRLSTEGRDLVQMASERLRAVTRESSRTFSGTIVALRHVGIDPTGYITVSTMRNGRMAEITVALPHSQYRDALRWHDEARVILVEADVTKQGGRLVAQRVTRCHPIDDLLSQSTVG